MTRSSTGRTSELPRVTPHPLEIVAGSLSFGGRQLWHRVNLAVRPGEFVAVLGPNGSGKSSLLKAILGRQALDSGQIRVHGRQAGRGNRSIGYIPQQSPLPSGTPLRARDLVGLGIDGHRWGPGLPSRAQRRRRVDALLDSVGAASYANVPVAELSGGEQQRLRVGQALAGSPSLLLCDEPLLSLDLQHQRVVSELIDRHRRTSGAAVLFVTHDINPVLGMVDRVLYLVHGRFRIGTADEVFRSDVLTELYGTTVEVFRAGGRLVVAGAPDSHHGAIDGSSR